MKWPAAKARDQSGSIGLGDRLHAGDPQGRGLDEVRPGPDVPIGYALGIAMDGRVIQQASRMSMAVLQLENQGRALRVDYIRTIEFSWVTT